MWIRDALLQPAPGTQGTCQVPGAKVPHTSLPGLPTMNHPPVSRPAHDHGSLGAAVNLVPQRGLNQTRCCAYSHANQGGVVAGNSRFTPHPLQARGGGGQEARLANCASIPAHEQQMPDLLGTTLPCCKREWCFSSPAAVSEKDCAQGPRGRSTPQMMFPPQQS